MSVVRPRVPAYRPRAGSFLTYVLVMVVVAFFILPFSWMISMGFKAPDEWFVTPPRLIPEHPTLANYLGALDPAFLRYAFNSILVSSVTTVVTIVFAVFSAYAFSRLMFPGRRQIFTLIILTQLLPLVVLIIPIYRFFAQQGLINTYPALIIAYLTFTVPVAVWLLRGFFSSIPYDLEEAAKIDGCTQMGAFLRIVLPLSAPGIAGTATYVFFGTWQELLIALSLTTSQDMRTLPIGILGFIGEHQTNWGLLMATSVLICIPVFVLFLFLQRQFVAGLVSGGVKG
jgi:ABC-type glycerol-3-phosphate transport system permease component